MEFFNFLWLIWDHYLPLPPTQNDRSSWPPVAIPRVGSKFTQIQIYYTKSWTQKYRPPNSDLEIFFSSLLRIFKS